jgi:hypothetical protein
MVVWQQLPASRHNYAFAEKGTAFLRDIPPGNLLEMIALAHDEQRLGTS